MKKRVWLGCLIFLFSLFILTPGEKAKAASGDKWTFNESTGTLTITGDYFYLGSSALGGLKEEIKSVVVKDGVTHLTYGVFEDCVNLTSVKLPTSVTQIPTECFLGCSNLKTITLPKSITSIGGHAFYKSGLTSITLPDNLTSIGSYCFSECKNLNGTVKIPEGIEWIENETFNNCVSLDGVEFPTTLKGIGDGGFFGCRSLTSVVIPQNVSSIFPSAFEGCTSLKKVTFKQGYKETTLQGAVFEDCKALEEVVFPSSVTDLWTNIFEGCTALKTVVILNPETSMRLGDIGADTFIIHGASISTARSYAKKAGNPFHALSDGVVTRKATYNSFGEKTYHCATCNRDFKEEILPRAIEKSKITSAVSKGSYVKVTWTASEGATGYKLYRKKSSGGYILLKTVKGTSYTDSDVEDGVRYTYAVAACTAVQTAERSTGKSVTFDEAFTLKKPKINSLTSTTKGVKVTWGKVAKAKSYKIYRDGKRVATTKSTSYTDKKAKQNGKSYKYQVVACQNANGSGITAKSDKKQIYYLMTQKITSASNKESRKLLVKYGKNTSGNGYQIQYSTSSTFKSAATSVKKVNSNKTTTTTLTKLRKKSTYYVRVRTFKKVNNTYYYSAWSTVKKVTIKK